MVGDPAGTRTPDLRLKRALLYQLSYWVGYEILQNTGQALPQTSPGPPSFSGLG